MQFQSCIISAQSTVFLIGFQWQVLANEARRAFCPSDKRNYRRSELPLRAHLVLILYIINVQINKHIRFLIVSIHIPTECSNL